MAADPPPLIWARLSGQGRGPARTLDHEAITAAAIALADADGLDAVSMRKVAARMEHSPMALYRHVGSKDDLIELMYDAVLGELDLGEAPSGDWQADLARLAREVRRLHHAHPWISRLGHRPTLGPNAIRLLEYGLAGVDRLGLGIDAMMDLMGTALQFTRGFVLQELGVAEAQQRTGLDQEAYRRQTGPFLFRLIEAGNTPYLKRLIEDAEDFPDPDVVFERRLAMVLNGLAAGLERPGSPDPSVRHDPAPQERRDPPDTDP